MPSEWLGRDSGPYFTLAECGDFGGKKARFGIEPGIGYLVWEGPGSTRVDFTLKYCMANLMGGEEDEADRHHQAQVHLGGEPAGAMP